MYMNFIVFSWCACFCTCTWVNVNCLYQTSPCMVPLTLYHTTPSFGDIEKKAFSKTFWENDKMLWLLYIWVSAIKCLCWTDPCVLHLTLTLSQTTFFLDSSKLKEFSDDNFQFDENGRRSSKLVENTAGKGEIARYEQFLLFPQCFPKTYCRHVKNQGLFWKGLTTHSEFWRHGGWKLSQTIVREGENAVFVHVYVWS